LIEIIKLIASIVICQLAGFIGSFATRQSVSGWYRFLEKPAFNPPSWIFAPVWISLYTIMGISLYLVWRKGFNSPEVRYAIILFLVQLVFNSLWSIVFFGYQSPGGGVIVITILWFLILMNIFCFYKISTPAGLLLIPYFLWVSFAVLLNFSIWRLN
jgi:translocator protein